MVHQLAVMFDKLRASGHGLHQRELIEDVRFLRLLLIIVVVHIGAASPHLGCIGN